MTRQMMIDLSSNNHATSSPTVKGQDLDFGKAYAAGVRVAIVKITEGLDYVNPWAALDLVAASKAGMSVGVYLFLNPREDGAAQANFAIEKAGAINVRHLCLVTDSETDGPNVIKATSDCLAEIAAHKITSPLYTSPGFIASTLRGAPYGHKWWAASWGTSTPRGNLWAWQHSETGRVPGIPGNVDLSWYFG